VPRFCRGAEIHRPKQRQRADGTGEPLLDRFDAGDERRADGSESAEEHTEAFRTVSRHRNSRERVTIV